MGVRVPPPRRSGERTHPRTRLIPELDFTPELEFTRHETGVVLRIPRDVSYSAEKPDETFAPTTTRPDVVNWP